MLLQAPTKPVVDFKLGSTTVTDSEISLQDVLANLELLYVKAKNYHWNVKGPEFYPLHKTFDGVQEVALDWADTIAERMRAIGIHVEASAAMYLKSAWFPESFGFKNADEMKYDLSSTLEAISVKLMSAIDRHVFDAVTENKIQDLCHDIDKQNYFVKSSI